MFKLLLKKKFILEIQKKRNNIFTLCSTSFSKNDFFNANSKSQVIIKMLSRWDVTECKNENTFKKELKEEFFSDFEKVPVIILKISQN